MTNLLQPLDVALFGSVKKAYRSIWNDWYINEEKTYTINNNARSPGLNIKLIDILIKNLKQFFLLKVMLSVSNAM